MTDGQKQIALYVDNLEKALLPADQKDVRRTFARNYLEILQKTNMELPQRYLIDFIHKAQLTGANPALNQIYLTTYFSKKLGHKVGVAIFSYHYMLSQATKTGLYQGVQVSCAVEEIFNPIEGKMTNQLVATATVRRKEGDEVTFKALWSEFYDPKNLQWRDKPYVMLQKCAIANCMRWAFPEALAGILIEEEVRQDPDGMDQAAQTAEEMNARFSEDSPGDDVVSAEYEVIEPERPRKGAENACPPDPSEHKGVVIQTENSPTSEGRSGEEKPKPKGAGDYRFKLGENS